MTGTHRSCASKAKILPLLAAVLIAFAGCNSLGSGKLAEQLRDENQRLVSEFRAQRDANEKLREKNQLLENRVAESEKLLARTLSGAESRISSRPLPTTSSLGSGPESFQPASQASPASNGELRWQPR